MGDTFKYVAPVAGALGYSIEDTAVAIGLMANSGIKASQAGTSLRSLLTNLTRPVGQAEDAINALGISITNTDGSVKPLSQTLQDLRAKFGALTDSEKAQYAAMLAGQEGMSGLLAIVNASDQEFESLTEQINNSSGAAQKMADVMMDNLSGKFELFTGALDSMKMSLGEKFKPYLIEALEWMTDKVPDVENALLTAMNSFDHFVDNAKAKIDEFTATDEWKNADLFGKIEIAWDELVAEPFSDWWNGSGKLKVAGVARDIGTGIGSAISAGILALMGVDVSSVIDEGSSIGRQFAEGFSEGMSGVDVSAALGTMVSGAFSSAGKLLPGGTAPDIGSLLSAAAIAKIAGPLMSFGSGAFKVGTSNKIRDAFGDIKLTMQEIEEAAKQIVFADQAEALNKFSAAAETADSSLATLQSSFQTMDKLNWKASLGMELDEGDMSEYISAVDAMIESSKQYLEDKHYEATAAIDLLIEPGNETDMTSGLNQMYSDLQTKIESLGGDLKAKVNVALEDGVITLDEQAEIANLQNQIADITNQISQAETEASFQSLKIKYSGASLDADSFASLVSEIQANVQDAASQYDEALQVSLTNLNLQLQNGAISQEQFDEQLQALTEGYQAKITDLSVRVESFELQSIADSFGSELDGILPELEGTVAERLGTAMHNAMANGVDVENWDVSTASEWLDLDGLSAETQSAITEMMSQVAASMPDQMTSALEGSGANLSESVNNMVKSGIENADFTEAGAAMNQKLGESLTPTDMSESSAGLQDGLQSSLMASVENIDLTEAGSLMNQKLGEAMSSVDMSESDAGLQEGLQNSLTAALEGIDLSESAQMINTSIVTALSSTEGIDMSGFTASMQSSITSSIEGLDYSGVTTAVGSGISNAITATMGTIQGAIDTLYSNVGSAINTAFSAGFSTTTTVTITANYKLANPSATISFSGGGTGTATVSGSISSHANGGFAYGPELTWWGEDGPEVIIPLGSKRRQRGLELWAQAGEMLGVGKHADGGIIGSGGGTSKNIWDNTERLIEPISEGDSGTSDVSTVIDSERNSDTKEVNLSVTVNPQFVISSTSQREDDILQIIKTHMKELADDLGGELADRLGEVFSNMPISS